MKVIEKSVNDLIPYENNPRENDGAVDAVSKSIEQFGFKVPIVIDSDNVIVAGHTRLKAAKKLGLKTVPVVVADDLSPEQVKAFRLADNKVHDISIWDNKKLLEELEDLEGSDLFTGFELGGLFDDTLDENDSSVIENNEAGVVYEVVFKSMKREVIERMIDTWSEVSGNEV